MLEALPGAEKSRADSHHSLKAMVFAFILLFVGSVFICDKKEGGTVVESVLILFAFLFL